MREIFERRSIRNFTQYSIPDEKITNLLKAAMQAPSAGNVQPWSYVVIDDRSILKSITRFHPYSSMLLTAPDAILVCAHPDKEIFHGFWPQDCSAATENILLECVSNNLGSVWLGIYPYDDRINGMRRILKLPEEIIPFSLVAIGVPTTKVSPILRFDQSRIYSNKWGSVWKNADN